MSSDAPTRSQDRGGWSTRGRQYIKGHPAGIAKLVADTPAPTEEENTWIAADVALDEAEKHGLIESLRRVGAIDKTDKEYYSHENSANSGGNVRNHYRWRERAYDDIREYLDSVTTFPRCEHRVHIFNPRDSDDDTLACRECGTEYHKDLVAELL